MNLEVQWCAFKFVEEEILSPELCHQIQEMFKGDCDLQTFAQTVLENELCDDVERVQELMDDAYSYAQNGDQPPVNYFEDVVQKSTPEDLARSTTSLSMEDLQELVINKSSAHTSWEALPSLEDLDSLSNRESRQTMVNLLISLRALKVSDVHLSAGAYPFARSDLKIKKFGDAVLTKEAAEKLNTILLTKDQKNEFLSNGDLDFAISFDQSNRFRVNLMVQKEGVAGTYRIIPNKIQTLEELGFPNSDVIYKLLNFHNGLILVTGPVGSGKSTTLAALVDSVNNTRYDHVICVEDPIELVHTSKKCNITQREVGRHTKSFATALKGALREDPDIIVIGELRDLETIEMAITASETGHLVIGTLHTSDATSTLNRLLDVFPPSQQQQIRAMTAESLKGIICQRLIPASKGGLSIAIELLINNIAVANNIRDDRTHQIKQVIETGLKQGMCTMDQSVFNLYEKGIITKETAITNLIDRGFIGRIK